MSDVDAGKVKLVFVGGLKAPRGYKEGTVYLLAERCENFDWFEKAPESAKIGEIVPIIGRTATGAAAIKGGVAGSVETDTSIPFEYGIKVKMKFIGGERAPRSVTVDAVKVTVGTVIMMPLRYARKPWWQLVDPLPDSYRVAPAPVEDSVVVDMADPRNAGMFAQQLGAKMGVEIIQADDEKVAPKDAAPVELEGEERQPVEISPEKLLHEEEPAPVDVEPTPEPETIPVSVPSEVTKEISDSIAEDPHKSMARLKLMESTVADLRMIAKSQGLSNYSKFKKADLVEAILGADNLASEDPEEEVDPLLPKPSSQE